MVMKALFIGRFQPFHKGHLKVIQNASKEYDEIIIGIGSSQYGHAMDNPFTSDERKKMINDSLKTISVKNYKIILIPDIHNPPKWVDHILSIFSDFEVVLSNNVRTRDLFSEKGYSAKETPLFNKSEFSGKEIRKRINKDEPWESLVPSDVLKIIKEIDGITRIKNLMKN
jgi:nicotinamide-nucleotide adenylyltransferase